MCSAKYIFIWFMNLLCSDILADALVGGDHLLQGGHLNISHVKISFSSNYSSFSMPRFHSLQISLFYRLS